MDFFIYIIYCGVKSCYRGNYSNIVMQVRERLFGGASECNCVDNGAAGGRFNSRCIY